MTTKTDTPTIIIGTSEAGAYGASASEIVSVVRGGGIGANAYVARIVGVGGKFGLERQFINGDKHLSGSGRSGSIIWQLDEDGIFELARFAADSKKQADTIFVLRDGGTVRRIERHEIAALLDGAQ